MEKLFNEENKYLEKVYRSIEHELVSTEEQINSLNNQKVTYDDAKRGEQFTKSALLNMYINRLRILKKIMNSPYFGRFDFQAKGSSTSSSYYIGKTNISDENQKQVVIDWRSPISSMYYDGFVGDASYEAPIGTIEGYISLKRQIVIEDAILKKVLDVDFATNDEILQDYLDIHADNKMKNIVASIQKEQNKIIRKPLSQNIIVQGVAGSGKTSVALHRIAYLTYDNQFNSTSDDFLIIGPNNCFLSYISALLPDLETEPVTQLTYIDLVNNYLKSKLSLENFNVGNKKSLEKYQSIKTTNDYKKSLEKFISDYLNNDLIDDGIEIDGVELYSKEYIKSILLDDNSLNPNFKKAELIVINDFELNKEEIYSKLNEKYRQVYIGFPKGSIERQTAIEKSENLRNLIYKDGKKIIKKYFDSKNLSSLNIYIKFIENFDKYSDVLSVNEIEEFKSLNLKNLKRKKVTFEDLAPIMHIQYLINGNIEKYKHVVIDEAQDLGLFHFEVLREIFPKATFSIYGDLAQSISSHSSIGSWEEVSRSMFDENCEIINLSKSYRTTIEITNMANNILKHLNLLTAEAVIRHGNSVEFLENSNNIEYKLNKIQEWLNKNYNTIAIICKDEKESLKVYKELSDNGIEVSHITSKNEEYKGNVFVLTCELAKGLEFDAVIINDASNKKYSVDSRLDMNLLYVASTRALHELEVLYGENICEIFAENVKNKYRQKVKQLIKR